MKSNIMLIMMTEIKDILTSNMVDYKKAKLIETILLEQGFRCFVEVDSLFLRIEELDGHNGLSEEKLYDILELGTIAIGKIKTEMGMFYVFYVPIQLKNKSHLIPDLTAMI